MPPEADAAGEPRRPRLPLGNTFVRIRWVCEDCGGSGKVKKKTCSTCEGSGQMTGQVTFPEFSRLLHVAATAGGEAEADVVGVRSLPRSASG